MMDLDEQLKQLALEAQRHPPKSKERQWALQKLVKAIWQSGRLYHPPSDRIPPTLNYTDIYEEALANLMLFICENIDKYDPTCGRRGSVMGWVNFYLDTRLVGDAIRRAIRDLKKYHPRRTLSELDDPNILDNSHPENIPYDEDNEISEYEMLRECLVRDPGNSFKESHVRNHPEANFQVIALLILDGKSWQEICSYLPVKESTLRSHYRRNLKNFQDQIKKYINGD